MKDNSFMSFKGIKMSINPTDVILKKRRKTVSCFIPYKGEIVDDIGKASDEIICNIIFQKDNLKNMIRLEEFCEQGGVGLLCIPNEKPVYAQLTEIIKSQSGSTDIMSYRLKFLADIRGNIDNEYKSNFD